MKKLGIIVVFLICFFGCNTSKEPLFYSYEKNTNRHLLHGPVKQLKQFGTIDTTNGVAIGSDKFNYYTASFTANRLYGGGSGFFKYDTLGLLTWRQRLLTSINDKFSDTVKAQRRNIMFFEYDTEDVKKKLQYKQSKKFPLHVHNPYRVKIVNNFYQAYKMAVEKDSTYKMFTDRYIYIKNKNNLIIKEELYSLYDRDLDGETDEKDLEYYANYIYDDKNQLIAKEYTITDTNPYRMTIDFDDFEFESIPKSYSPVIKYDWDDRGNLIRIMTIPHKGRNTKNHLEEYYYNKDNQLIKKRIEHPRSIAKAYYKHIREIHDLYFDERGNVIKVEAINNDGKTIYATYLYDYGGYDAYGNWTISNAYLDGDKTKKPNMVTKRIIEYYPEKKTKE